MLLAFHSNQSFLYFNQVNGHTEAVTTSGKAASDPPPPEEKAVNGSVCNGDIGPLEREELCMIPSRSQPRTGLTYFDRHEDLKHTTGRGKETAVFSSAPSASMLSSTVVTVLAPHRSGRLRRLKRSEENGSWEVQDGTKCGLEPLKETVDKLLTNGSRGQLRMPFSSSRQNTAGCRTDVDYETKRKNTQMVSWDVSSAGNSKREAASSNPLSPLPLNPNEQRTSPQTGLPGVPSLSLKPTSSSLLLSLRRSNCNVWNATEAPTLSEKKRLSPRTPDCNGQAANRPDSPMISFRITENGPVPFPSFSNLNQTAICKVQRRSDSPPIKGTAVPQAPQPQISADSSPRHVPYDHSLIPKAQPVPRRTTLTATSWWKQVTQDSVFPKTSSDAFKNNMPLASPNPDLIDLSRCHNHIIVNKDTNNVMPVVEGCLNLGLNTHSRPKTQALTTRESELPFKKQNGNSLNTREPLKSHSLPGLSPGSKISRPAEQTVKDVTENFTAKVTEAQASLLKPTSSETNTEEYSNYLLTQATNTPAPSHHAVPQTSTGPSPPPSSLPITSDTSSSFKVDAVPSHNNGDTFPQTLRLTNTFNTSPLGLEGSHVSFPFHPKSVCAPIPLVRAYPRTNCSHDAAASSTSPAASDSHSGRTTVCSTSPPSPSVGPPLPFNSSAISSSLLTPPATPILSSPSYSASSSPNEGRTVSSSQEKDPRNKNPRAEGKKGRRVTWEDSVDLQQSQKLRDEKAERCHFPADSPAPRPPVSVKAPSIFSLLRPSNQTSPICFRTPKISSLPVGKAGKYRSLSSDSADLASRPKETFEQPPSDCVASNQGRHNFPTSRHERTLSLESGTAQRPSSRSLPLPPELSSGYKLRYSSPPYTTLMSNRTAQKEAQPVIARSAPLQPHSPSNYRHLSCHTDPISDPPVIKTVQSPISPSQTLALPFQTKADLVEGPGGSLKDQDNNNNRNQYQDHQNEEISPTVSLQCLHGSPSVFITETLVYSIEPKADAGSLPKVKLKIVRHPASPPIAAETQLSPQPALGQSQRDRAIQLSDPGSSGNSLTEPQTPEDENSKRGVLGKSRYFSMESSHEQIQKRGRFALKRSTSTPNSNLSRSDPDKSNKTNTKMDQVVNKLKKTFSTKRSEDDLSFPWKWRRTTQTPSGNGSGDLSGTSVSSTDSPKSVAVQEEKKELSMKEKGTQAIDGCTPLRYTLTPPPACGENAKAGEGLGVWSGKLNPNSASKGSACVEQMCVNRPHSPAAHQVHFGIDYKPPSNQFLSCRDPSPARGPVSPAAYPTQTGKSTPSPRSPFSPFSSLSPVSPIPSSDVTDDVFYSPKLSRRREAAPTFEPVEGFSLTAPRRSRASTGPPSVSLSPGNEYFASSCADLKYGIEPGRSYSVSSVLSCRPSGPGRISTGFKVMSVGNLCESALTYAGNNQDLGVVCECPLWAMESNCRMRKGFQMFCTKDSTKMRSRSLPRSLTKCLSSWKSGVSPPSLGDALTAHPAPIVNRSIGGSYFSWDAEGPPTPPPTPPPSPLVRRMSKPPSPSSPKFPSSPRSPPQLDSLSKDNLPSRGHKSGLDTFDESSDSSSETTTDDEYYLETGEEEEKETEL